MTRSSNNNKTTFFYQGLETWSRGCLSEFAYTAWVKPGRGYNKHPTLDSVNSKFDLQQLSVKCRKCGKFRIQRKYFFIMCRQRATTTTTNCDEWAGLFIQRSGVGRGPGLTNMNFSYFENSRPALHIVRVWAVTPSSDLVKVQKNLISFSSLVIIFSHTQHNKKSRFSKLGVFILTTSLSAFCMIQIWFSFSKFLFSFWCTFEICWLEVEFSSQTWNKK